MTVFSRLFRLIRKFEEWLLASAIIVIALLQIANVISRTALETSLAFAEELTQFLMIFATFIGLGYAAARGRHIRMTALYDQLSPKRRKQVMIAVAAVTGLLLFVLAGYSAVYISTVRALGTVSPVLNVPFWLVYLSVPLGLVLAGIQYGLTVVRNLTEPDVYLSYEQKDEYEEPAPRI